MNQYLLVAGLLGELTAELQRLERWQAEHPGAEALASELPFCVDTLSFDQWLQFVLIPRMEQLVLLQAPLPPHWVQPPRAPLSPQTRQLELPPSLPLWQTQRSPSQPLLEGPLPQ